MSLNLLVNKTDLHALYLVGPTVTRPVQDPPAVQHLCMILTWYNELDNINEVTMGFIVL